MIFITLCSGTRFQLSLCGEGVMFLFAVFSHFSIWDFFPDLPAWLVQTSIFLCFTQKKKKSFAVSLWCKLWDLYLLSPSMGSVLAASSSPPAPRGPGQVSVPPGFTMPPVSSLPTPPNVGGQVGEVESPLPNPGAFEECHRKCKGGTAAFRPMHWSGVKWGEGEEALKLLLLFIISNSQAQKRNCCKYTFAVLTIKRLKLCSSKLKAAHPEFAVWSKCNFRKTCSSNFTFLMSHHYQSFIAHSHRFWLFTLNDCSNNTQ